MNFFFATFVVVSFAVTIEYLGLVDRTIRVGQLSKESFQVLVNSSLSDRQKEQELQNQSRQLFVLLGILLAGDALAIGLPLGIVYILNKMGIGDFHKTLTTLSRADFLIGITVVGIPLYFLARRLRSR